MKNKNLLFLGIVVILLVTLIVVFGIKNGNDNNTKKEELKYLFVNESIKADDDIISIQKAADKKLYDASQDKKYTVEEPYVLQNPYGISPLTALVVFTTNDECEVKVKVNGGEYTIEKANSHIVPIYGLIASKENVVTITAGTSTKTLTLDTTNVKNEFTFDVKANNLPLKYNDMYVLAEATHVYGYNKNGDLIWLIDGIHGSKISELKNGHFLVYSNKLGDYFLSYPMAYEIDYLGKVYNAYEIDTGVYSLATELENGNLLFVTNKYGNISQHDVVAELDRNTGKIVKKIVVSDIVKKIDPNVASHSLENIWSEIDSIYFDAKTNSIIVSMTKKNSIVSISYADSKINWIFGDIKNWTPTFGKYIVEGDVAPFSTTRLDVNNNGEFTLFKNGFNNAMTDDSCSNYKNANSTAMVVKITKDGAKLINEFDDNKSFFSYAVSDYYELDNGNYILSSSWELDSSKFGKANCTLNTIESTVDSTIYELSKDNNILFKATVNLGSYAGYKLDLFRDLGNYAIVDVKQFVNTDDLLFKTLEYNDIKAKLDGAEKYNVAVDVSKYYVTVNQMYFNGDEASLIFVNEYGKVLEAKIVNDHFIRTNINVRGIEGKYALFYKYNGTYYNLDATYEF